MYNVDGDEGMEKEKDLEDVCKKQKEVSPDPEPVGRNRVGVYQHAWPAARKPPRNLKLAGAAIK